MRNETTWMGRGVLDIKGIGVMKFVLTSAPREKTKRIVTLSTTDITPPALGFELRAEILMNWTVGRRSVISLWFNNKEI